MFHKTNIFFKKCFLTFSLSILIFVGYSQQNNNKSFLDSIFQNKKEVYFSFYLPDKNEINNLSRIISIDKIVFDTIYAYANKLEFSKFMDFNYDFILHPSPASLAYVEMISKIIPGSKFNWDYYPTYTAYENLMKQFAIDYPDICKLYCIDTLPSGRLLLAVKISDNVAVDEEEPEFLYTSSIHGDELTSYVLMLRLIDYLLANYGSNQEITDIIDNVEIWINPLANPDGTYAGGNNTISGATRYNANGVDLNRNYPDPEDGPHPDYMAWQPETIAFMKFAADRDFVMSANFHGGAEVFNYPWDTWSQLHADDLWWQLTGREYADTAQHYGPNGYFDDENDGITNGYAWYTISGSRQDYMNYYENCREVTIELSADKIVSTSSLNAYWNYNYRSILNYLKQVIYGLYGNITDACTGQGIRAKVFINSHDIDNSHIYSFKPWGRYYRPLFHGNYDITYSAPAYQSLTIQNINVNNYSLTKQDVVLQQLPPVADFIADSSQSCTGIISFINKSIVPDDGTTFKWYFGDGKISTDKNPVHKYNSNGSFDVKLIVYTSCGNKDSVIKVDYINVSMPASPLSNNSEHCGAYSFILSATGNGTINWYYSENDTVPLGTGNTFTTGLLDSTHTYYVEDIVAQPLLYGGKPDKSGNGSYYSSFSQDYLLFDCYKKIELVSVKVYAETAGIRSIYLLDVSGNIIDSKDINIPQGESRITLNFKLPVANNLKLAGPPGAGLFRNSSGVNYPYTVPGIISITSSSDMYNPGKYYFYFYDWELKEQPCISARIPVNAFINDNEPVADFNFSENGFNVQFIDMSQEANSFYWDFGDGNYSTLQNPLHQYSMAGNYSVKQKVINACGEDSITKQIIVTFVDAVENTSVEVSIFPNPVYHYLYINIKNTYIKQQEGLIKLYDMTGREVLKTQINIFDGRGEAVVDALSFDRGIYILSIKLNDVVYTKRLLITNK